MERSEEYEPIILDLQKSHVVQKPKRYVLVVMLAVLFLGTLAATVAALYYSKASTNGKNNGSGRAVGQATPEPETTPTVSVKPTPVTVIEPVVSPEPTPTTQPAPTATPTVVVVEAMGKLTLYSHPDNAEIVINGESIGQTPLENYELKPGTYTIKFSHQGKISEHNITITAGKTTEYTHRFEGFASLNIRIVPSRSDVFVNGKSAGRSPLLLEGLSPGTYEIVARKKGYADAEKTVTLGRSEHQEVLMMLKPLDVDTDSDRQATPRPLHPSERLGQ
jgi:hypothetical protein